MGQFFLANFCGRSVGILRICRLKKFRNPTDCPRNTHTLSVRRTYPLNMAFEACTLLKAEKILAFSSMLTITIVSFSAKVKMEEVWTEGHQQSEAAGHQQGLKERHRLHGDAKHVSAQQGEDLEKQKGRLPAGEEVTRCVCFLRTIQKRPSFLKETEVQSRTKFLNGVICGLSDRPGSKEA